MAINNPWHDISPGDKAPEIVNSIIEIPKDSKIKYELDKESGLIKMDRFLYSAVHYPGDYGFVPQTLWDDDDPLDIVILTGRPLYPGVLAKARVVGVLRMIDNGDKDDKVIAVYDSDPRHNHIQDIGDIPEHLISELRHFFEVYKHLEGKECKTLELLDKSQAEKDVKRGIEMYKKKYGKKTSASN